MRLLTALAVLVIAAAVSGGQERQVGYSDTPMLPGNRWHVHDGKRPQPGFGGHAQFVVRAGLVVEERRLALLIIY